jgi:hypothetical protein
MVRAEHNSSPSPRFCFSPVSTSKPERQTELFTTGQTSHLDSSNIPSCRVARALFRGSAHSFLPNGLSFKPSLRKE